MQPNPSEQNPRIHKCNRTPNILHGPHRFDRTPWPVARVRMREACDKVKLRDNETQNRSAGD